MSTHAEKFLVPVRSTHFGDSCQIRLTGLILILYRGNSGWRAGPGSLQFAKLPGQVYTEDLRPLMTYSTAEIVAVDLLSGEWQTIWASEEHHISHP